MTALTRECLPWQRVLVRMPRCHAMDSDCIASVVRITYVTATPPQAPLGGPSRSPDTPPPDRLRTEAQWAAELGPAMALDGIEGEHILAAVEAAQSGPTRSRDAILVRGSGTPIPLQVRFLQSGVASASPTPVGASRYGTHGRGTR